MAESAKIVALPKQDDDVIHVDSDWFTLDEIDVIEELAGCEFPQFMNTPGKKSAHLRIMALILKRRTDPDFPESEVGSLKVTFGSKPVPPTSGNGSAPS